MKFPQNASLKWVGNGTKEMHGKKRSRKLLA